MDSDYPFGIFKLFLYMFMIPHTSGKHWDSINNLIAGDLEIKKEALGYHLQFSCWRFRYQDGSTRIPITI
jgi:hypothetical protein